MAPRRAARGRGNTTGTRANTRRSPGGIRKNTRSRQQPSRYGQEQEAASFGLGSEITNDSRSESEQVEPSTPAYTVSPAENPRLRSPTLASLSSTTLRQREALSTPTTRDTQSLPASSPDLPINLNTMRELLRSHEQDIVHRVMDQLNSRNNSQPRIPQPSSQIPHHSPPRILTSPVNPILAKITELEDQLAQLRAANSQEHILTESRAHGTLIPTQTTIQTEGESASGIVHSVETLFPGVERGTLIQIIENRFKPTNIYRLLASEKDRAESNRTINIGGIEFEQTERDGRESEYRMSNFFKAWAAYSGILIKLAPYGLQGELATALCIYTMNLYDLLEKYTWEGVKAYHFQFHRKRVASGKNIYQPTEWSQLDSQLIASKCFAHPAPRPTWTQTQKPSASQTRRTYELPIREGVPGLPVSNSGAGSYSTLSRPDHRTSYPLSSQNQIVPSGVSMALTTTTAQPCRNWNYRECRSTQCRYQHSCISCGSSHRASQCPLGNTGPAYPRRNSQHGR